MAMAMAMAMAMVMVIWRFDSVICELMHIAMRI